MRDKLQHPSVTPTDESLNANATERLQREIELHRQHDARQSYLALAVSSVSSWLHDDDSPSTARLERLSDQARINFKSNDPATFTKQRQEIENEIEKDQKALARQNEVNQYATGFCKTVGLFMRGRLGLATTIAAYTLDKMNPHDPIATQLADFGLGTIEAGLLRKTYSVLGAKSVGIAAKGAGLGITSRFLDLGLDRKSYLDENTGKYNFEPGLKSTVAGTLNRNALIADIAVFCLAHSMHATINGASGSMIERSPLLGTMFTGTTFGFSTGATDELLRQLRQSRDIEAGSIIRHGLIQGALDTVAAAPGGLQADAYLTNRLTNWTDKNKSTLRTTNGALDTVLSTMVEALTAQSLPLAVGGASELTTLKPLLFAAENTGSNFSTKTFEGVDRQSTNKRKAANEHAAELKEVGDVNESLLVPRSTMGEEAQDKVSFENFESYLESNKARVSVPLKVFQLSSTNCQIRIPISEALYPRISAQSVADTVFSMPDPNIVRTLTISDYRHIAEPWLINLTGNEELRIKGETDGKGNVTIFKPKDTAELKQTVAHEFSHIMKDLFPLESSAFNKVAELRAPLLVTEAHHANDTAHEMYARLGEILLGGNQTEALLAARLSPIHAVLFARGLSKVLSSGHNSLSRPRYLALCKYIDQHVRPTALLELENLADDGADPSTVAQIRSLIELPLTQE